MAEHVFFIIYLLGASWMTLRFVKHSVMSSVMSSDAKAERRARIRAEVLRLEVTCLDLEARNHVAERKIHDIKYGVRQEK